jgi:hypothetical protein
VREEQNPRRCDFFVSYTGVDTAWAEWIAWQLKEARWACLAVPVTLLCWVPPAWFAGTRDALCTGHLWC